MTGKVILQVERWQMDERISQGPGKRERLEVDNAFGGGFGYCFGAAIGSEPFWHPSTSVAPKIMK